ncbi:hypothetical protein ACWDBD_20980 [Streptomyces sp. NPDC001118]
MQEQAQRMPETRRAAGLAGVVFALLLAAAIVLVRLSLPEGAKAVTAQGFIDSGHRDALRTALALVPFAGVFFLWFVGVVRAHIGTGEDKFVSTVFLGSGLVFIATMFGAAAAAGAVLAVTHPAGTTPALPSWDFGRHFAYTLMTEYATRMAAVFACSLSLLGHRLGILPRWLSVLGLLTALTLLFVASSVPWAELIFPAWSLLLSVHLILASGGTRPRTAAHT